MVEAVAEGEVQEGKREIIERLVEHEGKRKVSQGKREIVHKMIKV